MIDMQRLRSIFQPNQYGNNDLYPEGFGPAPNSPPEELFPVPDMRMLQQQAIPPEMQELQMSGIDNQWQPETQATDKFNQLIQNMPTRENPSLLRKIGALITGVGYDPEAGQQVLNAPYNNKIKDWKNQLEPAYQAANLERYSNANERQNRGQVERERANKVNEGIREQRANAYAFRIQHPEWKAIPGKGGTVQYVNPLDPTQTFDTGLDKGTLTDKERIQYGLENDLKKIEKKGDVDAGLEGLRQEGRIDIVEKRGEQARRTKSTASGGTNDKALLPTQERVKQFNKAREAFNLHPEWRKFIKLGNPGANDFEITSPGTTLFGQWKTGPDNAAYEKMSKFIYGDTAVDKQEGVSDKVNIGNTGPKNDNPPPGAKPGGVWTTTAKGRRIYKEP